MDFHGLSASFFSTVILITDFMIRIGLSTRVIMKRHPHGVTYAWLFVILLFPFFGAFVYLMFGENRISERRTAIIEMSSDRLQHWLETLEGRSPVDWKKQYIECEPIHTLARNYTGLPAMDKNDIVLLDTSDQILDAIIDDINAATSTCHMQFYIWEEGGKVDEVIEALFNAADRGVVCRILLDDIGSRTFLNSSTARKMRQAGIRVQKALPAGLIKVFLARIDIRSHRKTVIIDGQIAYTGSQNMADPEFFKVGAGVGNWVDVMVRIRGPVVESMAGAFINDWFLETNTPHIKMRSLHEDVQSIRNIADIHDQPPAGDAAVQLVPSGPGFAPDSIHSVLLTTIYAARKQLILTTPYFIPDNSLLTALEAAAFRGVEVTIILPAKNDSKLADYAARARYERITHAGVKIYQFNRGLLHSKTITVDGEFALFGSVNLDMRSFWLNFETTLIIYNQQVCADLQTLQLGYISSSSLLDIYRFRQRSLFEQFKENAVLMIGPLL